MNLVFQLLIAFQVKHLLADYFFQTEYMLDKAKDRNWFMPLFSHCSVHALGTMLICAYFRRFDISWICIVDGTSHFTIDRIKAISSRGASPANATYWRMLGIDQALHHCTHYFLIFLILSN